MRRGARQAATLLCPLSTEREELSSCPVPAARRPLTGYAIPLLQACLDLLLLRRPHATPSTGCSRSSGSSTRAWPSRSSQFELAGRTAPRICSRSSAVVVCRPAPVGLRLPGFCILSSSPGARPPSSRHSLFPRFVARQIAWRSAQRLLEVESLSASPARARGPGSAGGPRSSSCWLRDLRCPRRRQQATRCRRPP